MFATVGGRHRQRESRAHGFFSLVQRRRFKLSAVEFNIQLGRSRTRLKLGIRATPVALPADAGVQELKTAAAIDERVA